MKRGSTMSNVALAGGARVITLPISGLAGLLATNLLVGHYGRDGFAIYALVAFLPMLLPAADLGVGAAVLDAVARREELGAAGVYEVIRRGIRRLALSGGALVAISVLMAVFNLWPLVLGGTSVGSTNVAAALSLAVFAVAMPAALGLRVLQGLERTHVAVLIQGLTTVGTLLLVWFAVQCDAPLTVVAASQSVSMVSVAVIACAFAAPALRRAAEQLPTAQLRHAIAKGLPLSGSFFLMSIALPITFQTDRIVLAHTTDLGSVAVYSAGSQLFAPCFGVIAAAGQSLWPAFARQRAQGCGLDWRSFRMSVLMFTAVGLGLGGVLIAVGPFVTNVVTNGEARAGFGLMTAFALLLAVGALQYPGGMYLLDTAGARFQAVCSVIMALLNVPLAIVLSLILGATGTVLASAVLSLLVMSVPVYWRIRRQYFTPKNYASVAPRY